MAALSGGPRHPGPVSVPWNWSLKLVCFEDSTRYLSSDVKWEM